MMTTRRERKRQEAVTEILQRACAALSSGGLEALSLRALAADLGMAPSGVHYYFSSRDDLLLALIIDAFHEIAAQVGEAVDTARGEGPISAWQAGVQAYYQWALANAERFELAHSRTATRLKTRSGLLEAKDRAVRTLMGPLLLALRAGDLTAPEIDADVDPRLLRHLADWRQAINTQDPAAHQLAGLHAYTLVHGHVVLVLTGSLPQELLADDTLLAAQVLLLLRSLMTRRA